MTVFGARMPLAHTNWMGKVYKLNKKLTCFTVTDGKITEIDVIADPERVRRIAAAVLAP